MFQKNYAKIFSLANHGFVSFGTHIASTFHVANAIAFVN